MSYIFKTSIHPLPLFVLLFAFCTKLTSFSWFNLYLKKKQTKNFRYLKNISHEVKARGTFWQVSISGNLWGFLCHDGKGNGSSYVSVLRCLLWALYMHDVLLYCQTNNHNKRAITSWVCSIWIFKQSLINRDKCHELCNKLRAYKTFCYNAKCFVYHEHCFKDNECICILFSGWLKA